MTIALQKVGKVYVPNEGPDHAELMVVGEAPGENEEQLRRPFVGSSGQLLERCLVRSGVRRHDVYLANLCHYRPLKNKFEHLLGTQQLEEGLQELSEAILRVNPNAILAVGNWPMYFLTGAASEKGTPGTGITDWRGSVLPAIDDHVPGIAGRKVVVTYHPAYVVRPQGMAELPVFTFDIKKAVEQSKFPEIRYPKYEELVDPPEVWDIVEEMESAEWIAVDIETFGNSLACVGFADSDRRGLCITFQNKNGWSPAITILKNSAKKIFQFAAFDILWLWKHYGWEVNNYKFDTYIAAANLLPEFERGLGFLASIYTDFPFYKRERKVWKVTGDLRKHWTYNIKDCIATYQIAMQQMKELEELYGDMSRIQIAFRI